MRPSPCQPDARAYAGAAKNFTGEVRVSADRVFDRKFGEELAGRWWRVQRNSDQPEAIYTTDMAALPHAFHRGSHVVVRCDGHRGAARRARGAALSTWSTRRQHQRGRGAPCGATLVDCHRDHAANFSDESDVHRVGGPHTAAASSSVVGDACQQF
jgi:hypothetical protein